MLHVYTHCGVELGRIMARCVSQPIEKQNEILIAELSKALAGIDSVVDRENSSISHAHWEAKRDTWLSAVRSANAFQRKLRKAGRIDAADAMAEWIKTKAKAPEGANTDDPN